MHARKLTDYELGLYACRSYLKAGGPIEHRPQIASHAWIGYIKDLMWTSELDYFADISKTIVPRIKISNVIMQMMAGRLWISLRNTTLSEENRHACIRR